MRRLLLMIICFSICSLQIAADSSEESTSKSSESSMTEAETSEQVTPMPISLSTAPYAFNLSDITCSDISFQSLCRHCFTPSYRIEDENSTMINLNEFLKTWNHHTVNDSDSNSKKIETTGFEEDYHPESRFKFEFETESQSSSDDVDWREGFPLMEQRNQQLLNRNILADCRFEVGIENNTQLFSAHKVFFARASPIFEAIFNETNINLVKIKDTSPKIFEYVLSFVYSGSVCLTSFSEACELLHTASRLQIPVLVHQCRAYLWANLYPNNVWRGYICAQNANDDIIKEAALQIIEWRTDEAMKDPAFTQIPQTALVGFLSRDDLNVSSEVKLYEASLRWAISETLRRGLPQEPESLRLVLGDALGLIRFLTFEPSEFANMQATSKILTYSESLSVIFNLNSPGVLQMPTNISSNNISRGRRHSPSYFKVLGSDLSICKMREETFALEENTFDLYTASPKEQKIENLKRVIGFQIPTQIHCRTFYESEIDYEVSMQSAHRYFTTYNEDLTVYLIKNKLEVIDSVHFEGKVKCNSFITVNFTQPIPMYNERDSSGNLRFDYKIKVILHTPGRYPLSLPDSTETQRIYNNRRSGYINDKNVNYWYFGDRDFVYSMITEYY